MACDKSTTCGKVSYGIGGLMLAVGGILAILGVTSMGQAGVREYDCTGVSTCTFEIKPEQCDSQGNNCETGVGALVNVMIPGGSGDGKCDTNLDKIVITAPDASTVSCTAGGVWGGGCASYSTIDDHEKENLQTLCSFAAPEAGTYTITSSGEKVHVYKPWLDGLTNLAQGVGGFLIVALGLAVLVVGLLFALIPCCACKLPPAPAGGAA